MDGWTSEQLAAACSRSSRPIKGRRGGLGTGGVSLRVDPPRADSRWLDVDDADGREYE